MPERNPLSVDVRPLASASLEARARKHELPQRCGGPKYLERARARVEALAGEVVETHVDDSAVDHAARSAAVTLLHIERARKEHADAACVEDALERAHACLVEAAMLLECVADVKVNAERIRAARANALARAPVEDVPG